jgi:hypothetical protein
MRPFNLEKRWNPSAIATSFTVNTKTSRLKLAIEAENLKKRPRRGRGRLFEWFLAVLT